MMSEANSVPDVIKILITPAALVAGALIGAWRTGLDRHRGLGLNLPSARHALIFTAAFIALMGVHETVYQLFALDQHQNDWRRYDAAALAMRVVFVGLIYPVAEELFFRGFLLGLVARKAGPVTGIVATALLFTALHNPRLGSIAPLLVLADGLYFGFARVRSGSLLLPAAFHVLGNSTAIVQRLY